MDLQSFRTCASKPAKRAQDVNNIKHLAEMGVVFLLFNIGLELSMDRLASLAKFVFGMGSLQVGVDFRYLPEVARPALGIRVSCSC